MIPTAWCRFCGAKLSLADFQPGHVKCLECGRESAHVRVDAGEWLEAPR